MVVPTLLFIHPADDVVKDPSAQVQYMSWAEAQQEGRHLLSRFERIVCSTPRFPRGIHDHAREDLCFRLRVCVERGALILLTLPTSVVPAQDVDEDWARARHVVEQVTHQRVGRVDANFPFVLRPAARCPPRIAELCADSPKGFRMEGQAVEYPDAVRALLCLEDEAGYPQAMAGFAGAGAWVLLQTQPSLATPTAEVHMVFEELATLRAEFDAFDQEHDRALEQRGPVPPEVAGSAQTRARARATLRPSLALERGVLHLVPCEGRGWLQWQHARDRIPRCSALLKRGPWALASVLLEPAKYGHTDAGYLPWERAREALSAKGIPAGNDASLRQYLAQLRRAVQDAVGLRMPPSVLAKSRRPHGGTVNLSALHAYLRQARAEAGRAQQPSATATLTRWSLTDATNGAGPA